MRRTEPPRPARTSCPPRIRRRSGGWCCAPRRSHSCWSCSVAGIAAAFVGEVRDGLLILAGLVPLVGADVATEYRGERALQALRDASAPRAQVRRDGRVVDLAAADLVPGDIVLLHVGDVVPADLRLIRADRLVLDRSILTGESIPETMSVEPDAVASGVADRRSIAYSGMSVVGGQGRRDRRRHRRRHGGRPHRQRPDDRGAPTLATPGGARSARAPDARRRGRTHRHHGRAGVRSREPAQPTTCWRASRRRSPLSRRNRPSCSRSSSAWAPTDSCAARSSSVG